MLKATTPTGSGDRATKTHPRFRVHTLNSSQFYFLVHRSSSGTCSSQASGGTLRPRVSYIFFLFKQGLLRPRGTKVPCATCVLPCGPTRRLILACPVGGQALASLREELVQRSRRTFLNSPSCVRCCSRKQDPSPPELLMSHPPTHHDAKAEAEGRCKRGARAGMCWQLEPAEFIKLAQASRPHGEA